ncbi:hypothetical protein PICMEDRAFT_15780 [Pichia membranifaciens NRRL Y-2026]|uniref:IPT/TIG domain-containing protein n=1 Tax=Pichia membranifaciens NRRL Y-2026 TaxID=763406 RepID=A0A1E3NPC7_9ASCO|nr:hypothetical protein PICMEDRAFT_15780 [Pichia membranifaciens NRRL Y-2026]ODQ47905.1 hypothetical protein PICMEDRAFT_15780 [Pichia membranifaciens NRRL Y-2026]
MDTFMTFISSGAYPGKREPERTRERDRTTDREGASRMEDRAELCTPKDRQPEGGLDEGEIARQILEDEVLNEFLNPQCFQQPNEILDMIDGTQEGANNGNDAVDTTVGSEYGSNSQMVPNGRVLNPSEELRMYEGSKKELMKVKFGLNQDAKYIHHSNVGFSYTRAPAVSSPDDPEVTTTLLPPAYQECFLRDEQSFPYHIQIADLPSHSRVETQIKLELSISPPPPQFLLHIPRDSITKPKFTLADNTLPDSIQDHLLYLDLFIVGSQTSNANDGRVKSCNVCKRCMRRELKRASRRKAGLVDDSSNWDINLPKRAIIINSKEIVSFPAPNGNTNERKIELLSRIVCYCRHHQELEGFQILIFLKNKEGAIVGKTISTPILIMDRKKSLKSSMERNKENVLDQEENGSDLYTKSSTMNKKNSSITSNNSNGDSSAELSVPTSTTTMNSVSNNNPATASSSSLFNPISSVTNMNSMNLLTSNGGKSQTGMFSSIFSFDPSNLLGDENSRQVKRQKRPWSPSESSTYFETINQQRGIPSAIGDSKKNTTKRDPISPISSDAISPQNHLFSSATSAFSTTPEKEYREAATTLSPHDSNILVDPSSNLISTNSSISAGLNVNMGLDIDMNLNMNVNNEDCPTIRRIIPSQGPIRGGIEITLLGSNFRPGLIVKFGRNVALATQCWSDSTIVTYLPPASQAGPVLVTFEDANYDFTNSNAHQIFTYTDDTDRQLIELALQIVGLKMNGKLEDAKNIAKRIVGSNQMDSSQQSQQQQHQASPNSTMSLADVPLNQQLQLNWMAVASNKIKELSKSTLNHEEILIKFLSMIKIPNSLISSPNWAVCNSEGQTMLHLACLQNYSKLCHFLMKNGSRVDYKDRNGFTPLHFAFIGGNRKIINLLNKFKANTSSKLENGVLLSHIADSNVLDLIHASRRSSTSSSDINFDEDDEDNENMDLSFENDFENDTDLSYDAAIVTEELDDYQLSYKTNRHKGKRSVHHKSKTFTRKHGNVDSEFEADNEDDTDSIPDKVEQIADHEKKTSLNDKPTNSFGINLWIAMKEAIKNKMVEISVGQEKHKKTGHERHGSKKQMGVKASNRGEQQVGSVVESEKDVSSEDHLPSYDDLFPQGTSLRSLINFRGHADDEQEGQKKAAPTRRVKESLLSTGNCDVINPDGGVDDDDEADSDVDMIAMNLRTSINSDTKLMFFWLPCMLLLLLIVIGNNLNIITIQKLQFFSYFLEQVREIVGSFMLGKDRFTNLLNENINYGRERMENLINDVNDAMMTAVAGVGR